MRYLLILTILISSCNECEWVPMVDLVGQPILNSNGDIMCDCICSQNNWQPCNENAKRHSDCIW